MEADKAKWLLTPEEVKEIDLNSCINISVGIQKLLALLIIITHGNKVLWVILTAAKHRYAER